MRKIALVATIYFGIGMSLANCSWFDGRTQPKVSRDLRSEQRFGDATVFPYIANDDRRTFILENAEKVRVGMTGDEVFAVLDAPDDTETLAFPFESARGWTWDYIFRKVHRYAPDANDSYLELKFDREGKVSKIVRANLP